MAGRPWHLLAAALLLAAAGALRITPTERPAGVPTETLLQDWGRVMGDPDEESAEPANDMAKGHEGAALEIAVSEVIRELHPLEAVPVPVVDTAHKRTADRVGKRRSRGGPLPEINFTAPAAMRWIYGAQHKAGTNLVRYLAQGQASKTKTEICASYGKLGFRPADCDVNRKQQARIWFRCNFSPKIVGMMTKIGLLIRGVHMIRDPLALVVSGYVDHMKSDDTPQELLKIRNMPMAEGLAVETDYVLRETVADMLNTYLYAPKTVLHIRYESFTASRRSFDAATQVVYDHMFGEYLSGQEPGQEVASAPQEVGPQAGPDGGDEGPGPGEDGAPLLTKRARTDDLRQNPDDIWSDYVFNRTLAAKVREVLENIPEDLLIRLKNTRLPLGYSSAPPTNPLWGATSQPST